MGRSALETDIKLCKKKSFLRLVFWIFCRKPASTLEKMAVEYDVTGVITETSSDSCVVSVSINEAPRSFSFSKTIFYTLGVQCDGSMTNILDVGMEVELTYSISSDPASQPRIKVVWIGDKPQVGEDSGTDAIYDQKGRVTKFLDSEWMLVEEIVLVHQEKFFRDGEKVETFGGVSVGEEISFDATPCGEGLYAATCAWVGPIRPRLLDRFNLKSKDEELGNPEFECAAHNGVNGTVVVIPNDFVAIAEVKTESTIAVVLLFRSSFSSRSERISDVTEVGESLFMRLIWGNIFPGRRQWVALSAMKLAEEIIPDSTTVDSNAVTQSNSEIICSEPVPEDVTEMNNPKDEGRGRGQREYKEKKKKGAEGNPVEMINVQNAEVEIPGTSEKIFDQHSNVLYSEPPLTGSISRFAFDSGCISYKNLKIFVDRENFYEGGARSSVERFMECVSPGTNVVNFEALKTARPDAEKHGFTHDAICAWVGKKPSVSAVAKSLPPAKLLKEEGEIYFGQARKYHLPRSVLVVVPGDSATVVIDINAFDDPIPVHPSNGVPGDCLITNYIKLREYVRFEPDINPDLPNVVSGCKAYLVKFNFSLWNRIKSGYKISHTSSPKTKESENSAEEDSSGSVEPRPVLDEPEVFNAVPFKGKPRYPERAYLLNCQGILERKGDVVVVEHILGSAVVNDPVIYSHNGSVTNVDQFYSRVVCFDAASLPDTSEEFYVERMWTQEIAVTRPPAECLLVCETNCPTSATFLPKLHYAKITSIPLYDCAIATVKGIPVLVPLEAVVTFVEAAYYASIGELLSVGDDVAVNVEKLDLSGGRTGKFCRAISCWKLELDGKEFRGIDKIGSQDPEIPTWFKVWGFGEYYRKERIISKNGGYFVEFTSSRRPNLNLCLNLFEKSCVYVNGLSATQEMFKHYVGHEIMFHVAHAHPEKLIDFVSDGMFVACAWIGEEPSAEDVLKARLMTPDGLVSDTSHEAVVEDFPLPTHVICLVGAVSVLVPLSKIEERGKFVGVSEEDLKKGDRVLLHIERKYSMDCCILVSDRCWTNPVRLNQSVLRNITGSVVEAPNPTGIIKALNSDLMVPFNLCHVRDCEEDTVECVLRLRNHLTVGSKVRFTAIKVKEELGPFRAVEVFVYTIGGGSRDSPTKNLSHLPSSKNKKEEKEEKHERFFSSRPSSYGVGRAR